MYYATGTPVLSSAWTMEKISDSVTNHSVSIDGLTASTTYYYLVKSTDASNNTGISDEMSFTTDAEVIADKTAPVISSIGVIIGSTITTIS